MNDCEHWDNMPFFNPHENMKYKTLRIHCYDEKDISAICKKLGIKKLANKNIAYYPERRKKTKKKRYFTSDISHKFPIYIVSKGRAESSLTAKSLEKMGASFYIVIESQEKQEYLKYFSEEQLLVMPDSFVDDYDSCDSLGRQKSKGAGCARNFAWQHSIDSCYPWHWVMHDNIRDFYRVYNNSKIKLNTCACLSPMQDFCLRYKNIGMAGPAYSFMMMSGGAHQPLKSNTRIYSCNLIRNDLEARWRGRYNKDTILSLDILKSGLCTVQFNAFLQGKVSTQTMPGGNTKEFYQDEGTLLKSKMLVDVHPDISTAVKRFGRDHHHVDYSGFTQPLVLNDGQQTQAGINDYEMVLHE